MALLFFQYTIAFSGNDFMSHTMLPQYMLLSSNPRISNTDINKLQEGSTFSSTHSALRLMRTQNLLSYPHCSV